MDALSPHTADAGLSRAPKLKVFISYSRDDLQFADQLDAALDLCNFESVLDRHGISGGRGVEAAAWQPDPRRRHGRIRAFAGLCAL